MEKGSGAPAPFRGGVAVVTGGAAGIGEGIVRAAAECGMALVLADIAREPLDRVVAELRAQGHHAHGILTDVSDPAQVERLAETVFDQFGLTTLLVNNVGIELLGFIWEISAEDWRRTLDINVLGMVNVARAFVPRMLASGAPGWIANLSSLGGLGMAPLHSTYMVSKHAVLTLAESLSLEMDVIGAPIKISAVLPGPVRTGIFEVSPVIGDDPFVAAHRQSMRTLLRDNGLEPIEAGRRILAQVADGAFWVSPHPEMLDMMIERRVAALRDRSRPRLGADLQAEVDARGRQT